MKNETTSVLSRSVALGVTVGAVLGAPLAMASITTRYYGGNSGEAESIPWDDTIYGSEYPCDLEYEFNSNNCGLLSTADNKRACYSDATTQLGLCNRSDSCKELTAFATASCGS
jgi:hypothetical protein